jgi:ligand-binding sensor domain-containing protein
MALIDRRGRLGPPAERPAGAAGEPKTGPMNARLSVFRAGFVLACFSAGFLRADNDSTVRFGRLRTEDGLSHSKVAAIEKDIHGFMWFGTDDGLNRFDGYSFQVYRSSKGDTSGLASDFVRSLLSDRKGRLWVGTDNGLNLYRPGTDDFRTFRIKEAASESRVGWSVKTLFEDSRGNLWVGTNRGLDRFDEASESFVTFRHDPKNPHSLSGDTINAVFEDRERRLWVCTTHGLNLARDGNGSFTPFFAERGRRNGLSDNDVRGIAQDGRGRLWIGTLGGGVTVFDPASKKWERFSSGSPPAGLVSDAVLCLTGNGKNRIFVGTQNGGLKLIRVNTGGVTAFLPSIEDEYSIGGNSIYSLRYDSTSDILWIGTFNAGVSYTSPYLDKFTHHRAGSGRLSNPKILSFLEDRRGDLWVGTDGGGVNRIRADTGTTVVFSNDPRDPGSLSANAVLSMCEDRNGALWFGTWAGGANRLDRSGGRFEHFRRDPDRPNSLSSDNVFGIFETRAGNLHFACMTNIDVYDRTSGAFLRFEEKYGFKLDTGFIFAHAEDRDGNLWFGTDQGLTFADLRNKRAVTYVSDPADSESLAGNTVYAVIEDTRRAIWLGTRQGLCRLDRKTGKFRTYTRREGLPHNTVAAILEDASGSLWLATSNGISKAKGIVSDPGNPRFQNYGLADGIQGNEFRYGAFLKTREGQFLFGGNNGFNSFTPDRILDNPVIPPVALCGIRLFDREVKPGVPGSPLERSILDTPSITLSRRQSVVTFEFTALNFIMPSKNRYAYFLEGFDREWTQAGTRHEATYTNLDPGRYTFHVTASNNDGLWNEDGTTLQIRITRPFWSTPGFWSVLLAIVAAGIFGWHRSRLRVVVSRAREPEPGEIGSAPEFNAAHRRMSNEDTMFDTPGGGTNTAAGRTGEVAAGASQGGGSSRAFEWAGNAIDRLRGALSEAETAIEDVGKAAAMVALGAESLRFVPDGFRAAQTSLVRFKHLIERQRELIGRIESAAASVPESESSPQNRPIGATEIAGGAEDRGMQTLIRDLSAGSAGISECLDALEHHLAGLWTETENDADGIQESSRWADHASRTLDEVRKIIQKAGDGMSTVASGLRKTLDLAVEADRISDDRNRRTVEPGKAGTNGLTRPAEDPPD